jgi:hypothetical protein
MPANNDYPTYNKIAPSWADVVIRITPTGLAAVTAAGVKGINTNVSLEVGEQRAGGRVMQYTAGSVTNEGSLVLYVQGWRDLVKALKDAAPVRGDARLLRYVTFDVNYVFTPVGETEIYERRLRDCFLAGMPMNSAEGTDAVEVEVPLKIKEIIDIVGGEPVQLL